MTRIAPLKAVSNPGPLGFGTGRTRGSRSRTALTPVPGGTGQTNSGFEAVGRQIGPHVATPRGWSAIGVGLGLAAGAATAAWAVWRIAERRGKVRIDPAALHLHSTPARPPEAAEPVSVLIPMRHQPEAAVAAVRAALCQRGVDHLDVVVLDDGCPQETRAALRRECADDPRVRILAAAPLPRGWSPLAHRSHQLAVAARGRVLIFTEPCAPLGPHAVASATALLRGEQLDLAVLDTGRPAPSRHTSARAGDAHSSAGRRPVTHRARDQHRAGRPQGGLGRTHPGRFTVAVDTDAYWRIGGYRAAATDPDPLALLRMVRRASGRVAVADGRRVIPPAQLLEPLPPTDAEAEAQWDNHHSSRASLTGSARRVLAALVGSRP